MRRELSAIEKIAVELAKQGDTTFIEGTTEDKIAEFEREHGITLPAKFKEWLLFSDGGSFFDPCGLLLCGIEHRPFIVVDDYYVIIGMFATGDSVLCNRSGEKIIVYSQQEDSYEDKETYYPNFISFLEEARDMLGIHFIMLDKLNKSFNVVSADTNPANKATSKMRWELPSSLPVDYDNLLCKTNGLEISVEERKTLRIWGVADSIEMNKKYNISKYLPKAWAIGVDNHDFLLAYVKAEDGWYDLYAVPVDNQAGDVKVFITSSLYEFLVEGEGVEAFLSF